MSARNSVTWQDFVGESSSLMLFPDLDIDSDEEDKCQGASQSLIIPLLVNEFVTPFKDLGFFHALSWNIAKSFSDSVICDSIWMKEFTSIDCRIYDEIFNVTIEEMGMMDLTAINERDPASGGLVSSFLFFKGYKALQAHRIAHIMWRKGRKNTARAIQSRCSEVFNVDIHPGAIIGPGLMIDHGLGVVIGETCRIGYNCTMLHGVTLGSTGKEKGDRHPKIGHDVLIGCNATILGNITIGNCCKIGSGSIVLKPLPNGVTAVGNPAKVVGQSLCTSAARGMDLGLNYVINSEGENYLDSFSKWDTHAVKHLAHHHPILSNNMTLENGTILTKTDIIMMENLNNEDLNHDLIADEEMKIGNHPMMMNYDQVELQLKLIYHFDENTIPTEIIKSLFNEMDLNHDGMVNKEQFQEINYTLWTKYGHYNI
eukprot:gene12632-16938_t